MTFRRWHSWIRLSAFIGSVISFAPDLLQAAVTPIQLTTEDAADPQNMVLIAAGPFQMGDATNDADVSWVERPLHVVDVSAFFMDRTEVTKALWDEVKGWKDGNGYIYEHSGLGKAANHPVQTVSWFDVVKWCNARSQKDGRTPVYYTDAELTKVYKAGQVVPYPNWNVGGYRLPTEAEWEKGARGGNSGLRFPWGATVSHSQANYNSRWEEGVRYYPYDLGQTHGCHPTFAKDGVYPYTSPVGYFAANAYGLYDVTGNVSEWCWDPWSRGYYESSPRVDPRGPTSGVRRALRGGSWSLNASCCRAASRSFFWPDGVSDGIGFRCVLTAGRPKMRESSDAPWGRK